MRKFLVGVLVGVVLSVGTGVTAFLLIGSWLAVEDPLAKADAIVAISGDTGARANTAITLWKDGWAPVIVFSGAAVDPESVSSAEIMRRETVWPDQDVRPIRHCLIVGKLDRMRLVAGLNRVGALVS